VKGLLISVIAFVCYVLSTMVVSHVVRPKGHLKTFALTLVAWTPLYFALYALTPRNVYILPEAWLSPITWLDAVYGFFIFVLNSHSYMDTFFAFNGGFSMSLMHAILTAGDQGMTAEELVAGFIGPDGVDKIYGRRIPNLEKMGCIRFDRETGLCHLTGKGRTIAKVDVMLKRLLNLGAGG
jgi:hypothetical protein